MANETGHWYSADGQPKHFIECKSREGLRPSTLADARKNGWYPSVTSILKAVARPQLTDWLIRNAVVAAVTTPRLEQEGLDDFVDRILARDAQDESQKAMDLGSEIHKSCEEHFAGRLFAPQFKPYVDAVVTDLASIGRVLHSEKVLVHPSGFAGRTDVILEGHERLVVVDLKSCKKFPDKLPWFEHRLQVASYASCLGNTNRLPIHTAVEYISTVEPGKTRLFVMEDWEADWITFQHVFAVWKALNTYDPLAFATATTSSKEAS